MSCEYLRKFSKLETAPLGYLGAWGNVNHEKKPEVENLVVKDRASGIGMFCIECNIYTYWGANFRGTHKIEFELYFNSSVIIFFTKNRF